MEATPKTVTIHHGNAADHGKAGRNGWLPALGSVRAVADTGSEWTATVPSEVRFVQPYQATKTYRCPGCGRDVAPGTGHWVVVPQDAPDLRRHWHKGCWTRATAGPRDGG